MKTFGVPWMRSRLAGFTLVEIMMAMFIMTLALLPVVGVMSTNVQETDTSGAQVAAVQALAEMMEKLIEEVPYKGLRDSLALGTMTSEIQISNMRTLKYQWLNPKTSTTEEVLVFDDLRDPETEPKSAEGAANWRWADEKRKIGKLYVRMKVQQLDRNFTYLKNKDDGAVNAKSPATGDVGTVQVIAKLMRIQLWGSWNPSGDTNNPRRVMFSLTSFKADLDN